jgi:nucleotide-binding universal stress UspA family protein
MPRQHEQYLQGTAQPQRTTLQLRGFAPADRGECTDHEPALVGHDELMSDGSRPTSSLSPVVLCFDGSDDAVRSIKRAGELLRDRAAVVLTVWEPVAQWEPDDPGALISAGVTTLASDPARLDQIVEHVAQDKLAQGLELVRAAGFTATGRVERGTPWPVICDVADEIDAAAIVMGARGLSRVGSMLLGRVSSAVLVHTQHPVLVVGDPQRDRSEAAQVCASGSRVSTDGPSDYRG